MIYWTKDRIVCSFLEKKLAAKVAFSSLTYHKGRFVVRDYRMDHEQYACSIDELTLSFSLSFSPFSFSGDMVLRHPKIHRRKHFSSSKTLPSNASIEWKVINGEITLGEDSRTIFFNGYKNHQGIKIHLQHEKEHIYLVQQKGQLLAEWDHCDLDHFGELRSLCSSFTWNSLQGETSGSCFVSSGNLFVDADVHDLRLSHPQYDFGASHVRIDYKGPYKISRRTLQKLFVEGNIEKGFFATSDKQWSMDAVDGRWVFGKNRSQLQMQAMTHFLETTTPLTVSFESKNAWWEECQGTLISPGSTGFSLQLLGKNLHSSQTDLSLHCQGGFSSLFFLAHHLFPKIDGDFDTSSFQADIAMTWDEQKGLFYSCPNLNIQGLKARKNDTEITIQQILGSIEKTNTYSCDLSLSHMEAVSWNKELRLRDAHAQIAMDHGVMQKAHMQGDLCGFKTTVHLEGPMDAWKGKIDMRSQESSLPDQPPVGAAISVALENDTVFLGGIAKGEYHARYFDLAFHTFLDTKALFRSQGKFLRKGWIRTQNFPLELVATYSPSLGEMKGIADMAGFFDSEKASLYVQGKDVEYKTSYLQLSIPLMETQKDGFREHALAMEYDFSRHQLFIDLSPVDGTFYLPQQKCLFSFTGATLQGNEKTLQCMLPVVKSDQVDLSGKCLWDILRRQLHIEGISFQGSITDVHTLFSHFALYEGIEWKQGHSYGNFFYFYDFAHHAMHGRVDAYLDKASGCLKKKYHFFDLSAHFGMDTIDQRYFLEGLEMKIGKDPSSDLLVMAPIISRDQDLYKVDLRLERGMMELFRLRGEGREKDHRVVWTFDKELCHCLAVPLRLNSLAHTPSGELLELNMEPSFTGRDLSLLKNICAEQVPFELLHKIPSIEGEFHTKLYKDSKESYFWVEGKKCAFGRNNFQRLFLKGHWNEEFFIDHFSLDDWEGEGHGCLHAEGFEIEYAHLQNKKDCSLDIKGRWEKGHNLFVGKVDDLKGKIDHYIPSMEGNISGNGSFCLHLHPFRFDTHFYLKPAKFTLFETTLDVQEPFELYYSTEDGIVLRPIKAEVAYKNISFETHINEASIHKEIALQGAHVHMSPEMIEAFLRHPKVVWIKKMCHFFGIQVSFDKAADFFFDMKSDLGLSHYEIFSKEGLFWIDGKERHIKDLCMKKNEEALSLAIDYFYNGHYFCLDTHMQRATSVGETRVFKKEDPSQAVLYWRIDPVKNMIVIDGIEGEISGVSLSFYPQKQTMHEVRLFGRAMIDFSKAKDLFEAPYDQHMEKVSLGKGYEFLGEIVFTPQNFSLNGSISGKNFSLMGFELKTLFANIHKQNNRWDMADLEISDPAGHITIDKITYEKGHIECPKIIGTDIRPCMLHKVKETTPAIKPLVVRSLKIQDITGNVFDPQTIHGSGEMRFINSFKRSHAVLDLPSELLSRIVGLDQELLVPVEGELTFALGDKKCYFTSLKNAYSENHRSKFTLLDPAYIDFSGNININIKMKQYVLFKITDKFDLSISGNVFHPDINLRKKKSFFR